MDKYLNDPGLFYKDAFERNIGILTELEQGVLKNSTVAVVGCGGVGGIHIMNLVRTGIGALHIADMEDFEVANFQRQAGASVDTIGLNKAAVMKGMALAVNPHLNIKVFEEGVTDANMDEFLLGADVLVDGIDFFAFYMRRKVFNKAREKGMYTVTAGPLGFGFSAPAEGSETFGAVPAPGATVIVPLACSFFVEELFADVALPSEVFFVKRTVYAIRSGAVEVDCTKIGVNDRDVFPGGTEYAVPHGRFTPPILNSKPPRH